MQSELSISVLCLQARAERIAEWLIWLTGERVGRESLVHHCKTSLPTRCSARKVHAARAHLECAALLGHENLVVVQGSDRGRRAGHDVVPQNVAGDNNAGLLCVANSLQTRAPECLSPRRSACPVAGITSAVHTHAGRVDCSPLRLHANPGQLGRERSQRQRARRMCQQSRAPARLGCQCTAHNRGRTRCKWVVSERWLEDGVGAASLRRKAGAECLGCRGRHAFHLVQNSSRAAGAPDCRPCLTS